MNYLTQCSYFSAILTEFGNKRSVVQEQLYESYVRFLRSFVRHRPRLHPLTHRPSPHAVDQVRGLPHLHPLLPGSQAGQLRFPEKCHREGDGY